ncbi:hypothetical protein BVX98_03280, partial [bacterium F11]
FRLRVSDEENTVFNEIQIRVYPDSGPIPPNPNPGEKKKYDKVLDLTQMEYVEISCAEEVTIHNRNGDKIATLKCEGATQTGQDPLGKAIWNGENIEGKVIAAGTYITKEKNETNIRKVTVIK